MSLIEVAMGLYTLECARTGLMSSGTMISVPFLLLFASGYLYVGLTGIKSQWLSRVGRQRLVVQPS